MVSAVSCRDGSVLATLHGDGKVVDAHEDLLITFDELEDARAILAPVAQQTDTKPVADVGEKPLPESERASLLRLILGMAMDSYGYDPAKERNTATGEKSGSIWASLERCGLRTDNGTIHKYLTEAAQMYPNAKPRKP